MVDESLEGKVCYYQAFLVRRVVGVSARRRAVERVGPVPVEALSVLESWL